MPDMNIEMLRHILKTSREAAKPDASISEMRQTMLDATQGIRPIETATIGEATLGGVRAQTIVPEAPVAGRTLLYFHGGGYVIGTPETHTGMVSYIADAMQATCWSMDYRLAPEAPFPEVGS